MPGRLGHPATSDGSSSRDINPVDCKNGITTFCFLRALETVLCMPEAGAQVQPTCPIHSALRAFRRKTPPCQMRSLTH